MVGVGGGFPAGKKKCSILQHSWIRECIILLKGKLPTAICLAVARRCPVCETRFCFVDSVRWCVEGYELEAWAAVAYGCTWRVEAERWRAWCCVVRVDETCGVARSAAWCVASVAWEKLGPGILTRPPPLRTPGTVT